MSNGNERILIKPDPLNSKIWRYMDFTKYVSMLMNSSLFFVRSDKFEDTFEGSSSKIDVAYRKELQETLHVSKIDRDIFPFYHENLKKSIGVCSWHLSEYESAAMWKLYLHSNEGVAVQSTFEKLENTCNNVSEWGLYTGLVKYTDYENEQIPQIHLFSRFLNKRKSFDFEKEVRSIFFIPPKFENGKEISEYTKDEIEQLCETIKGNGRYFKMNLNDLVENVVISPYMAEWYFELVEKLTQKLGYNFSVSYSTLSVMPSF